MLICDKRRPARARGYQYQAPPRGPNKDSPPGLRPAPRALLGRGLAPPDPQGCAPWRAFAHRAPAASVIQPEGFRARVRRWRGWATACGCPCPTPSPWRFSGFGGNFKGWAVPWHGGGFGGRAPRCRATVGNPAQAVGGQGAAAGCARRPRTGRGCPRATGPQYAAPAPPGTRPPQALRPV